jgi:predicted phosphodiesterase
MRILAVSDIHADYRQNLNWAEEISNFDYREDILLIPGDISHDTELFKETLSGLRPKFSRVFFMPGNHDLWIRRKDFPDSLTKLRAILALCRTLDVDTQPKKITGTNGSSVWIFPLFSWYEKPEESRHSLYVPKNGEDPAMPMWVDDKSITWDGLDGCTHPCAYFLRMNESFLCRDHDAPIISFSHFLPRRELMFPSADEPHLRAPHITDTQPRFNFSRVAGSLLLDAQIRLLGSAVHVYGHQHRNRIRRIDDVTYLSCCLGYPRERKQGRIHNLDQLPLPVWDLSADPGNTIPV